MDRIKRALGSVFNPPAPVDVEAQRKAEIRALYEHILNGNIKQIQLTKERLGPSHSIIKLGLIEAVILGNNEIVECLFDDGKDVNEIKALHTAIDYYHRKTVKLLLDLKVSPQAQQDGITPLHLAIKHRDDFIRLLCEHKADVNMPAVSEEHFSALLQTGPMTSPLIAEKKLLDPLAFATKMSKLEAAKILLEFKADINTTWALHQATKDKNHRNILFLFDSKVDINIKDEKGQQPIHFAAANKDLVTIKLLCDLKADVYAKDNIGDTPLHYVVQQRDFRDIFPAVKLLLEKKVNPDVMNNNNQTVYDIATQRDNKGWAGYGDIKRFFENLKLAEIAQDELSLHLLGEIIEIVVAYIK